MTKQEAKGFTIYKNMDGEYGVDIHFEVTKTKWTLFGIKEISYDYTAPFDLVGWEFFSPSMFKSYKNALDEVKKKYPDAYQERVPVIEDIPEVKKKK